MGVPLFTTECPQGVYQIAFEITEDMINETGRMSIGALARQMQHITESHFNQEAGLTGEALLAKGLSWVISWTNIELLRLPEKGEQVILGIWPGKNKVNLYSRIYAMYTADGEPLMATSSLFLLMDQNTRTVAAQPEEMKIFESDCCSRRAEPSEIAAAFSGCLQKSDAADSIDRRNRLQWSFKQFKISGLGRRTVG